LLPFTLAESHGKKLSSFLGDLLKFDGKNFLSALSSKRWAKIEHVHHHIEVGGLPGISFKRERKVREKLFKNHLDTLFGRDIHLIYETGLSITKLEELYALLCEAQGEPINYLRLARQVGSTAPTIKKVVDAMEGLFLVRRYGKTIFAEDLGLASFAMRFKNEQIKQQLLRFLFSELRAQVQYLFPTECRMRPYSTRGGIDIPFLLEFKNGTRIAICAEGDQRISDKTSKSLTWFRKKYPRTKAVICYLGEEPYLTTSNILCLPWTWIC
jgi:predicted AAA+ superfamily ATPase